jgi:hypothetical protein
VPHVIEAASSGRAKCRGCDQKISKDELRFGERQPNAFGEGEMTLWFHLKCAAYKRPEALLEGIAANPTAVGVDDLAAAARFGIAHRRVPRINGAERAPTARARCRQCKELIDKGAWRIGIVFFEEYRFSPGGYIHASCASPYFETTAVLDRIAHFSPALDAASLADVERAMVRADAS